MTFTWPLRRGAYDRLCRSVDEAHAAQQVNDLSGYHRASSATAAIVLTSSAHPIDQRACIQSPHTDPPSPIACCPPLPWPSLACLAWMHAPPLPAATSLLRRSVLSTSTELACRPRSPSRKTERTSGARLGANARAVGGGGDVRTVLVPMTTCPPPMASAAHDDQATPRRTPAPQPFQRPPPCLFEAVAVDGNSTFTRRVGADRGLGVRCADLVAIVWRTRSDTEKRGGFGEECGEAPMHPVAASRLRTEVKVVAFSWQSRCWGGRRRSTATWPRPRGG